MRVGTRNNSVDTMHSRAMVSQNELQSFRDLRRLEWALVLESRNRYVLPLLRANMSQVELTGLIWPTDRTIYIKLWFR